MSDGKRRTEITIETSRRLVVTRAAGATEAWCQECGQRVFMVTVDEAALAARLSSRTIYRQADSGDLHCAETRDGRLLICLKSLQESIESA